VASSLSGAASRVRVLDLAVAWPECPPKGDISDWLAVGHTVAELESLIAASPDFIATQNAPDDTKAANSAVVHVASAAWPEPLSLPEGLSPVENFDLEFIPPAIGPWVADISERMQCPPEYIAVSAMVGLGSVLGRKIAIRPQRKTDWLEVANLWGCVVGRPGMMKSPAMMEALKPLYRLENTAREAYGIEAARYAQELELYQLRRGAAETIAKAALKKDVRASIEASPLPPEEPRERRYIANDVTYEKLGEILADNPNGVLAHRDELVSLLKTLDREEYAPARGFFLTAWSGTQGYTFDRVTRGKTHVEAACLSVLGSTQPGRLAEYVRRATSGGSGDDGLIQRFGLLVWPDQTPTWRNVDRFPDGDAKQSACRTFDSFDSLLPSEIGAEADDFQSLPFLRFDGDAQGLFLEWRSDLEARLRSADLQPAIEAHLAKYRKLVPALALIGHLAEGGTGAVGKAALMRALAFAEYLESHARRAYGAGPEAEVAAAKSILGHIRNNDLHDGFTARDIHRHNWSHLTDRGQIQAGLNLLSDLDWIAIEPDTQQAGRPSYRYRINPRAHR
jgi:putative DNA primase/helicase